MSTFEKLSFALETWRLQRRERLRERDFTNKNFKIQQRDGNENVS